MQLQELSLELTNECRLSCLHCSSGSLLEKLPDELTISKHLELIEEARAMGATTLSLSGGEPLLYCPTDDTRDCEWAFLMEVIHYAIDIHGYKEVLLYTTGHGLNGNHINDYKYIDDLLRFGDKLTFIFSLHSPNYVTNDVIMNMPGTMENIQQSIEWLVEQGVSVNIHMVPMKSNYRDMWNMARYCVDVGVKKLSLLRFVPQTRGKDNEDKLGMTMAEFAEMQFLLYKLSKWVSESQLEIRMGCPIDFRHAVGLLSEKAKPCHAGDDLMLVRPTGDVHPCAAWKSLPCDTNVKDHSLKWIWENSEVFNGIRRFKNSVSKDWIVLNYKNPCYACDMRQSCLTGCPAQRIHAMPELGMDALTKSIYSDPLCPRGNGKLCEERCYYEEALSVEASCDCGCGCVEHSCQVTHAGVV